MKQAIEMYLQKRQFEVSEDSFQIIKAKCNLLYNGLTYLGLKNWSNLNSYYCLQYQDLKSDWENQFSTYTTLEELKRFINWMTEEGYFVSNPIPVFWKGKKPPLPKRRTPSEEEIQSLLDYAKSKSDTSIGLRNYALVRLMLVTGIRPFEMRNLTITNFLDDVIEVKGKKGSWRNLVIDKETQEILIRWIDFEREKFIPEKSECEFIFPNRYGQKLESKGLIKLFQDQLNTTINATHLRHFYATQMEMNGCPIKDLQLLMGHSPKSNSLRSYVSYTTQMIRVLKAKFIPIGGISSTHFGELNVSH